LEEETRLSLYNKVLLELYIIIMIMLRQSRNTYRILKNRYKQYNLDQQDNFRKLMLTILKFIISVGVVGGFSYYINHWGISPWQNITLFRGFMNVLAPLGISVSCLIICIIFCVTFLWRQGGMDYIDQYSQREDLKRELEQAREDKNRKIDMTDSLNHLEIRTQDLRELCPKRFIEFRQQGLSNLLRYVDAAYIATHDFYIAILERHKCLSEFILELYKIPTEIFQSFGESLLSLMIQNDLDVDAIEQTIIAAQNEITQNINVEEQIIIKILLQEFAIATVIANILKPFVFAIEVIRPKILKREDLTEEEIKKIDIRNYPELSYLAYLSEHITLGLRTSFPEPPEKIFDLCTK